MEIIPAIDLRGGRCVRLYQGDYSREMRFSDDPLQVALKWQSQSAPRLHIIDLDGAAGSEPQNLEIARQIAAATLLPTQMGGGIRTLETIKEVLTAGIERVILTTAAIEDPDMLKQACRKYGDYVVISIDAREGLVATHGWQQDTGIRAVDFGRSMAQLGVQRLIYTDIIRDGTLTEPNFTAITELVNVTGLPVIAAGGISSILHLKMLKQLGVEGAILGRALYSEDINLKEAIETVG
ncbi:MAG: 1-(5-phosphoribosyl)-5-[(5-phosphoribosylamino)methylideneamino]imidazole-4-carboxamide isomerase [Dehalococcoidales bacterium]|nr:MAG: 1-(5-phosphoribosyl)-5-[(5-phosphoribosylamino)methylideneamino]imidazole-4-carboxamide isomerase [Dehalococcoidales bacterium]